MAEETPDPKPAPPPAKKVVTIKRFQIGVNVLVQLLAVLALVIIANYISFHHFQRIDASRNKKYELSEQTRQVLQNLKKPVKAFVVFSGGAEVYTDLLTILREYEYASKKQFQTEMVDPYRNISRARELQGKYKFGANENVLILDYEGKSKFVNAADMAEMDQSGVMFGQPPTVKAFKGEQAITSALLELTEDKQSKIYLLTGHGEPALEVAPSFDPTAETESIKALKTYLERQNVKAASLKLADVDRVPEDAQVLLVLGPKYDFSEREMKLLGEYWDRKGRIFLALDPSHPVPRLAAFLAQNAVAPQNDRILRTVAMGTVTGVLRDVSAVVQQGSPITKRLAGVNLQFLGPTQSLAFNPKTAQPMGIATVSLIKAGDGYWGETEYVGGEDRPVYFDTKKDHAPPISIAVSVEKGALSDNRVTVETARMVVVGNGEFLRDDALTEPGLDFTLGSINWLLNREDLIAVAPKERKTFTLNLTEEQLGRILLVVVIGVPGLVGIMGLLSWWQRRR